MKNRKLSKSRFVSGLQCHKLLWWKTHEPDAPELQPDESLQVIFDQGTRIGEIAREYVPGGVLIDCPHYEVMNKVKATKDAIEKGAKAIYEASFIAGGVFVAVDILEKTRGGWNLIEVKSTTSAKPVHIPDVAVQKYTLEKAGIPVKRVFLMHLNRGCRYPDLSNLFARTDLTSDTEKQLPTVRKEINRQKRMLAGKLPKIEVGEFCTDPYECPFMGRCWPEMPEHHVSTLYRMKNKAAGLEAQGFETIFDMPGDYPLSAIASRQREAVKTGQLVVVPGLRKSLESIKPPIAFLDFETINLAIPAWNGCLWLAKIENVKSSGCFSI